MSTRPMSETTVTDAPLSQGSPHPPPLPVLDTEAFRRALAGLADPDRAPTAGEKAEVKEAAIRWACVLAHLFGDDLDRLTLWSRIDSALETSLAKVSDDDLDRFAHLCLEHVRAEASRAAACDALVSVLGTFTVRPPEWRHAFLHYVAAHRFAVIAHGRARWELVKAREVEL